MAFAGGYSAGHIIPGLALHERLSPAIPSLDIVFIGSEEGPECDFVRREGMPFTTIPVVSYTDRSFGGKIQALVRTLRTLPASRKILHREKIEVLVVLGSYVGVAPTLAAVTLGIPVIVFEPNSRFGLANRFCGKLAREVWLSRLWQERTDLPAKHKVVGVPIRAAIDSLRQRPAMTARIGPWKVLTLGGSRGHNFLNHRAPALWSALQALGHLIEVTHICGVNESTDHVKELYQREGVSVRVESYVTPLIPTLGESDFILTSAGAISLHEIAALRIPCLVVPLKYSSDNHQDTNGEMFCRATQALLCREDDWTTEGVTSQIHDMWKDASAYRSIQDRMASFNPEQEGLEQILNTVSRLLKVG